MAFNGFNGLNEVFLLHIKDFLMKLKRSLNG
jgi:hypothetical protein